MKSLFVLDMSTSFIETMHIPFSVRRAEGDTHSSRGRAGARVCVLGLESLSFHLGLRGEMNICRNVSVTLKKP